MTIRQISNHQIFKSSNYFASAWRNIVFNKTSSLINIVGLSVGMAVAMMIGFWIWDELAYNKVHQQHDRIAMVMEKDTRNDGEISTGSAIPWALEAALRKDYGNDFTHIVMASWTDPHTIISGDKKISYHGNFMGAEAPDLLSLKMIAGTRNGLQDPSSILLSNSVATALFANADPLNKMISLDNKANFKISGVYQDIPSNSEFHDLQFIAPWDFYASNKEWIERDPGNWSDNSLFMYVQIAGNANMERLSEKIKNIKRDNAPGEALLKPQLFLQPMNRWHLYSEFKNGVNTGGAIQYVWLFGIIGLFVLLLACINFMNLSTARSERRAKEVGIRKAIGSLRSQLIIRFFCESLLMAFLAFLVSILLVYLMLPYFNQIAGKQMQILWNNPLFWISSLLFTLFTGLVAGVYPALYLSSFNPVKVLKGSFKTGRSAAIPRKVLVVLQFTVSIILITGTMIVYRQIQFARSRPIGYSRNGLINIEVTTNDLHKHFDALRTDLLKSGAVIELAESSSPTTGVNNNRGGLEWKGKDPAMTDDFGNIVVTSAYGKTIGWQFVQGRDFSSEMKSDSLALVLNETAVKYMGLKNPTGEIVKVGKRFRTVIGVVKDMVMSSPYGPVKQTIFYIGNGSFDNLILRINPAISAHSALDKIEAICKIYSPSVPFAYSFADDDFAAKFKTEVRISTLANFFAALAIFISCLGLFGMASFIAEQRIREIGIRKVLGASVVNLWALLSKDFIVLVLLSAIIATPIAYYFMHQWLMSYTYRTAIPASIFGIATIGALSITIVTVSYQSIKAALTNPVKSLKTE